MPFLREYSSTLRARKINNFYPRHPKFGFVYSKRYVFILCGKKFRFIDTLRFSIFVLRLLNLSSSFLASARAIHQARSCHFIFKRAHRVENSTKYRADDLCANLVCEYFCWMLGDPHIFSGDHFLF